MRIVRVVAFLCVVWVMLSPLSARSPLVVEAEARYYRDDFKGALTLVEKALRARGDDPEPLLISGAILAHRRDFAGLALLVRRVKEQWPESLEATLLEGDLLFHTGKATSARETLEAALEERPGDQSLLLNVAVFLAATGEAKRAAALIEQVLSYGPLEDAMDLLACAAGYMILPGRLDSAGAILRECRRRHGVGSQLLLLEGLFYYKGGAFDQAVRRIIEGLERNLEKVNELMMFAPLLAVTGRVDDVCDIVARAAKSFPHDEALSRLLKRLEERRKDEGTLETLVIGRVTLSVPPDMSLYARKSLALQTRLSLKLAERFFGCTLDGVRVRVLGSTGVNAPAYYDSLQDEILVSRTTVGEGGIERSQLLGVLRHEMGHLVANSLMITAGIDDRRQAFPLWFAEGLAECVSRRVVAARKALPSPLLSEEVLLLGLSVMTEDRPACRAAYAQACLMVDFLVSSISHDDLVTHLVSFAKIFSRTGDVNTALEASFGVKYKVVLDGIRSK